MDCLQGLENPSALVLAKRSPNATKSRDGFISMSYWREIDFSEPAALAAGKG
jgi:hypothetical protein